MNLKLQITIFVFFAAIIAYVMWSEYDVHGVALWDIYGNATTATGQEPGICLVQVGASHIPAQNVYQSERLKLNDYY